MNCVDVKHNIKVDIDVTLNNQPVDDVLRKVCELCHEGIMDVSVMRQESDDNPSLNTAKNWKDECESVECILHEILDLLGD
jgi:hypothetical protein